MDRSEDNCKGCELQHHVDLDYSITIGSNVKFPFLRPTMSKSKNIYEDDIDFATLALQDAEFAKV